MKPLNFRASSLSDLMSFSDSAKRRAGFELDKVQRGEQPSDFKPMPSIGKGVEEIRVRDVSGAYRVVSWRMLFMCCIVFKRKPGKQPSATLTWPRNDSKIY